MTKAEAIAKLDALAENGPRGDCETMHIEADRIILALAGRDVAAAYDRVNVACKWFVYA